MPTQKEYLFVCGPARSGTTAFTEVLSGHASIALGIERYKQLWHPDRIGLLQPAHFASERFFDFDDGMTNIRPQAGKRWAAYYAGLQAKYDDVRYVGDKLTRLPIGKLAASFPGARFACIVRNVVATACSWDQRAKNPGGAWRPESGARAAVVQWNNAVRRLRSAIRAHPGQIVIVEYERFFGDPTATALGEVLAFLGLDLDDGSREAFVDAHTRYTALAGKERRLDPADHAYVTETADLAVWDEVRAAVR